MAGDSGPNAAEISKWTGLYRSVGTFSIPPGAMNVADNVVVPGPSLLRPRRGFEGFLSAALTAVGSYAGDVATFDGTTQSLLDLYLSSSTAVADGQTLYTDLTLAPALLSGFSGGATYQTKTRFFQANGNLYQSTNFGLARTGQDATWYIAGLQAPYITTLALTGGTLLPALGSTVNGVTYTYGSQVAYRLTLKVEDSSGNVHVSQPSDRRLVTNTTGAAKDVQISAYATDWYDGAVTIQLWRTFVAPVSAVFPDSAGDEMFLVAEVALDPSLPGHSLLVSQLDSTPSIPYLTDPLYTNPTTGDVNGLGIGNANTPPPAAADVFTFKNRTYFCNTEQVQALEMQIIGTGSGGIVTGDAVTIAGVPFMFIDDPAVAAPAGYYRVLLYYVGNAHGLDLGTQEANIAQTALNLSNQATLAGTGWNVGILPANPVDSTLLLTHFRVDYTSPPNGVPGKLEARRILPGASAFSISALIGGGRGWAGSLATNTTSDPNRQPANLMQSQPDDPESVPPAFTNTVGALEKPILRGLGLRDSAFIFKGGGDGLWKFTDDGTGELTIGPLDQTVHCVAPETVVSLDNTAIALCDKGVLRISDGGAPQNLSDGRIQQDLAELMRRVGPDTLARFAFAVAYESERMYVLNLPETPNATACTLQYVYNVQTDAWTRWTVPATTCGHVDDTSDRLMLGRSSTPTLYVERKNGNPSDYQDPSGAAIDASIELLPLVADEPLFEKQWQNVYFYFAQNLVDSFDVSYATEKQITPVVYPMSGPTQGAWLYSETLGFGEAPWGGPARNVVLKLALDQKTARGAELTLGLASSQAGRSWTLTALRIPFDPSTMRVVR